MKRFLPLLAASAVLIAATGHAAVQKKQRSDYLSREEVQKVRDTMDPGKRIKLFLEFATERLEKLEGNLKAADGNPEKIEKKRRELTEGFDHYIRAIDDAAGHLEMWLERGGVDLRKLRKGLPKAGEDFVERLSLIRESQTALQETDLRYDLEDALEATEEMLALGKRIPNTILPPQIPSAEGRRATTDPKTPAQPGRPTLRRKGEDKSGRKPDPKPPPLR